MERPIAVLGAGPVGSILAANLAAAGARVLVIEACKPRADQIRRDGFVIRGKQTATGKPCEVLGSIPELRDRALDALFICTKTWALRYVLPELKLAVTPETPIVNWQNGIGPEEDVATFFPRERLARGIVNYAGDVSADTGVTTMQWFTAPNYLGPLEEGHAAIFERLSGQLSEAGLTTETLSSREIKRQAFWKTILNSALNALCADAGITMRQAMVYPHTRRLARLLVREGLSVAAAVGYNYGEQALDECLAYLDKGGDHLPSMWHDLQRRSLTEIEFINGKIAKIGTMFQNIRVDVNLFFTAMIVTQEIKSGARQPEDIPEYLRNY